MSLTISNFPYLAGRTCSVSIGGLDCGDIAVASTGTLTVPWQSDPQKLLTQSYLLSISNPGAYGEAETQITLTDAIGNVITVNVPVVVGYPYTAQGQRLRPDGEGEIKSPVGPNLGKQRRGFHWAMLLTLAGQFSVGTMFSKLLPVRLTQADRVSVLPASTGYKGIIEGVLNDDHSFDTMLCWQIDRPVPFVVTAASTFVEGQES